MAQVLTEEVTFISTIEIQSSVLYRIKKRAKKTLAGRDPAHDFQHIMRVYKNAELIGRKEGADMEILLPAVLLHDLVIYPKGSAKTSKSADDSADLAEKWLRGYGYPQERIDRISYCIRTHSYSKRLVPLTLEGKILQDADRLDAMGAIGIARTFSVGGTESRAFYNPADPFWNSKRELNDREWTLDHFQTKLRRLKKLMHTKAARDIAKKRAKFMELYIRQLRKEI